MRQRRSQGEWEEIGRQAILDLLSDRFVAPWSEVESRISNWGWKDFHLVQPVQLAGARQRLRDEGRIVEETTKQTPPITTLRLPYPPGRKSELEDLRGQRRKKYRTYLSWAMDQALCGKHAERVVLESAKAAASAAGIWVPPQVEGNIGEVNGVAVRKGPLDGLAHVLEGSRSAPEIDLVWEVKNIHGWVYPWSQSLWELLVKAADLAVRTRVMAVLVCVRAAWQTGQMAKDIGFLSCQLRSQLFNPTLDEVEFCVMALEFGLVMERHEGPWQPVIDFFEKTVRLSPPPSPPWKEDIPWYKRQAARLGAMAPTILRFDALAGDLPGDQRSRTFNAFKVAARQTVQWERVDGW